MSKAGNLYADLSAYYDQFCAEVDYAEQCAFAERAFKLFALSPARDYLDLACGTGPHLQQMQVRGFTATGIDNSVAMLKLAALRCPTATLQLCDLAEFGQVAEFDLLTCFLYSLHYSHPLSALAQTLQRAWQALKPGGVFIFNAVDARGISNAAGIVTQLIDGAAKLSFRSGWYYRGEGEVLDLRLTLTRETAEGPRHWHDHHTMTAVTLPELNSMLEDIGFIVTMLEHDYQVISPWQGGNFNAIFVACKPPESA